MTTIKKYKTMAFRKLTREQELQLDQANSLLNEARNCLDAAMYYCGETTKEDHQHIREIYTLVCKAQDLL